MKMSVHYVCDNCKMKFQFLLWKNEDNEIPMQKHIHYCPKYGNPENFYWTAEHPLVWFGEC